ncbi:hypothetical protein ACFQ14_11925 [Pseudahrensia aquimaris]|uniref:Calcium-binding protein n=1 Tax=Pseudahrensia aquimaris TaxID=744461 RepID=A0ABW3FF55_9HYPH
MTINILTSTGVDTDHFFPGLRGGTYTVLTTTAGSFTIQYNLDGLPGQGLVVEYVSLANDFTYSGTTPTGGSFTTLNLFAADGVTKLGEFLGTNSQSLLNFAAAGLNDDLNLNGQVFTGNAGDDVFRNPENSGIYIGNAGNDTFVVGNNMNSSHGGQFHGSAADGSGGAGEINTIELVGGRLLTLNGSVVTDIDALIYNSTLDSRIEASLSPNGNNL